jgi:hypothetical protein
VLEVSIDIWAESTGDTRLEIRVNGEVLAFEVVVSAVSKRHVPVSGPLLFVCHLDMHDDVNVLAHQVVADKRFVFRVRIGDVEIPNVVHETLLIDFKIRQELLLVDVEFGVGVFVQRVRQHHSRDVVIFTIVHFGGEEVEVYGQG